MTTTSTNLGFTLFNSTTDATSQTFLQYRTAMAGTALTSNLNKIDTIFGVIKVDTTNSRVGIGTTGLPTIKLEVRESISLGATLGAYQPVTKIGGSTLSNSIYNDLFLVRDAAGSDWITSRLHDSISVDTVYRTPGVDTKVWWERDPYNSIQSWGNAATTWMTLNAGKLGIGNNPTYTFQVGAGTASQAFSITDLGTSVRIGINIIPQSIATMTVYGTYTETSGSGFGGNFGSFASPTANSTVNYVGLQGTARTGANAFDYTGVFIGVTANVVHQGTGSVSTMSGITAYVTSSAGGNIINAYAIQIQATGTSGGGTVTNAYGLYIAGQSTGSTLNYSIYTNAGLVHFGDSVDLSSGKNITLIAGNIITDTTTGTKIGTATTQKLGFWNATPIVQPTTSVAASTFTANSGTAINDASTFDGYTVKQVVKALRNSGLLA